MSSELNGADSTGATPPPEPPIRRSLARRAVVILVIFFIGIVLLLHFAERGKPAHAYAPPVMPVVAAAARTGDLPIYLNGLGSVTPLYTVTVRTRVDGELFSVPVKEGQMVSAGDVIAEIDPRPFQVQLLQAQGQKERDEAILANAKVDLERYRVLYAQNSVPKQQLDTQAATVNQDEAIVKSDQAAVESAKLNLTYSRITAPISGRIGLRLVDPGNIVHASDQNGLVVITQMDPISVLFTISEDELPVVLRKMR